MTPREQKRLVRQFLVFLHRRAKPKPRRLADVLVYTMVRRWAISCGFCRKGGAGDPGPIAQGGDGGGP